MKFIGLSNLLIILPITVNIAQGSDNSLLGLHSTSEDDDCPPWSFYNDANERCECYSNEDTDGIVRCTAHDVLIQIGYCMTFQGEDGFYVGPCTYYYDLSKYKCSDEINYISLPRNVSELNNYMCGPLNRMGILCGECDDRFGIAITSDLGTCKQCTYDSWLSLLGFLLLELLQVIVVYFVVLLFRIKFTSAPMIVFIFFCQIQEFVFLGVRNIIPHPKITQFWWVLIVFYGIFNFHFFQYIIPAFCISPNLKTFQSAFFDYIPLIYLLLLLVITWVCLKLHSKKTRLIVWAWNKLNNSLLIHINAKWDAAVDAFVTIFFLTYANLVYCSIWTALSPVVIWNAKNFSVEGHTHVYLNPDMEFYGKEHLPSAVLSSVFTIFIVLPLPIMLALFPFRWFRSILFKLPIIRHNMGTINTYLDRLYSCYRDGLNGGRDMRSFVSLYYFVYWILGLSIGIVQSLRLSVNVGVILYTILGFLIALIQPYKKKIMNVLDSLILANLSLFSLLLTECRFQISASSTKNCYILLNILNAIIPITVVIAISYKVFKMLKKLSKCRNNIIDEEELEQASFNLDIDEARDVPDHLLQHSEQNGQEESYGSTELSLPQSHP